MGKWEIAMDYLFGQTLQKQIMSFRDHKYKSEILKPPRSLMANDIFQKKQYSESTT